MWKPPSRIRYAPRPGEWPSVEIAEKSLLFAPLEQGRLALRERTWVPAMVPWRASDDGFASDDVVAWYRRFALGQPGAIVVEATGIRDVPSGPLLRIGDDRFLDGLKRITTAVREASGGRTKLFIQLIDFLSIKRRPQPEKYFERFLRVNDTHREALAMPQASDDAVRAQLITMPVDSLREILSAREFDDLSRGARERVTDLEHDHIRDLPNQLPDLFAAAAKRAESAGFDGVELHYAHAYTMASFLSALNDRNDGYGGSHEGRMRLPLEVFQALRAGVDQDFVVGCRYLADDCIDGGNSVDDATVFGVEFARAGMDFISLSRGGKFEDAKQPRIGEAAYPYTGPSGYECMPQYLSDEQGPFGRNVAPVSYIRAAIRAAGFSTPIVVAGGIHGFEQAERILDQEQADIVGFARQALADPDWFAKVRSGHGGAVRVCEYTNYCEGLDQKHKQVTCQLWDREDLSEPGIALSKDGRRRLIAPSWNRRD